jgi:two-component system alkaline phosphatase synthesis response regulator PhoP
MSRSDPPVHNAAVLVVDADRVLRGLFTTLLGNKGFAVDTAADGRIAFDQIRRHNDSVILLDLMMPEINGFELLDRLERDSPSLMQKVIVMTGASQRATENLDLSRVWGLIRKPFDIDNLVSSTVACAEGKRSH